MFAAETHLSIRENCGARLLPNWNAETVSDIPAGTDLRVLRDEDRDFIKVAYGGRPLYIPRVAATTPSGSTKQATDGPVQSFVLRRGEDPLLLAAMGVASLLPAAPGIFLFWPALTSGWITPLTTIGLIAALISARWIFTRGKQPFVAISDDAILVQGAKRAVIPAEQIDRIGELVLGISDVLRISIASMLPLKRKTLTLVPFPCKHMLELTLKEGFRIGWGRFSITYHKVLFDVEDRGGFLKALAQVTPQVRIDPTLAARYGA